MPVTMQSKLRWSRTVVVFYRHLFLLGSTWASSERFFIFAECIFTKSPFFTFCHTSYFLKWLATFKLYIQPDRNMPTARI